MRLSLRAKKQRVGETKDRWYFYSVAHQGEKVNLTGSRCGFTAVFFFGASVFSNLYALHLCSSGVIFLKRYFCKTKKGCANVPD